MRKVRSDCTVGAFEKSTDYQLEQSVTKVEGIPEVIRKLLF